MSEEESKEFFEQVPAKKQGHNLPIGLIHGNELVKPFSLGEISPDVEREVGRFRELNSELPATVVVSKLISCILETLGGEGGGGMGKGFGVFRAAREAS